METFMKDNGQMIRQMGKVSILIRMGQNTQDNGRMINSMDLALKNGWMDKNMRDNIEMVPKLVKVCLNF